MLTFQCLPLFLPSFLLTSLFHTLSVSVSLLSLSFFLLVFFFLLSFASFFSLFLCFCFIQRTTSKHYIGKLFSSILSVVLWFLVLLCLSNPFFLSLFFFFFSDFKLFLVQRQCFLSKKTNINCWSRGGCNKRCSLNNLCFAKCEKLSFFLWPFLPNFGWCFKTAKSYFSTFLKVNNFMLRGYYLVQVEVIIWSKFLFFYGQLGPDSKPSNFRAQLLVSKKRVETPIL